MTDWLTAAEAAAHARLKNTRMIMAAVKAGELPASTIGKNSDIRHIRIKQSAVDEWLESKPWEPA